MSTMADVSDARDGEIGFFLQCLHFKMLLIQKAFKAFASKKLSKLFI